MGHTHNGREDTQSGRPECLTKRAPKQPRATTQAASSPRPEARQGIFEVGQVEDHGEVSRRRTHVDSQASGHPRSLAER